MGAKIGEGGFGAVYRGQDLGDKAKEIPSRECAAKKVHLRNKDDIEAFNKELDVLSKVQTHPGIIGLFGQEFIKDDGWVFMEMATGGELFDRLIDSGNLSETDAWPYAKGIADAISHCHSKGIVHRDLKLENVMLCGKDPRAIKVVDFGLAVAVPLKEDGCMVEAPFTDNAGTMAYKPPEVNSKKGYSPVKVDSWAAGIVLFSLVSGFFPLQEASSEDWRYKKLAKDQGNGIGACESIYKTYKRSCPFSPELKELLNAMLAIDVSKRLTMPGVRAHRWFDCEPKPVEPKKRVVYRGSDDTDDPMDDEDEFTLPEDSIPIARQAAKRDWDAIEVS